MTQYKAEELSQVQIMQAPYGMSHNCLVFIPRAKKSQCKIGSGQHGWGQGDIAEATSPVGRRRWYWAVEVAMQGVKRLMEYAGSSLREGALLVDWIWGCKEEER